MFGIVIVSHSRILAKSLAELAIEMGGKNIPVAYAGGVEGKDDEYGTDATDIMDAVESVYSEEGVVIFADMGSALISSETAVDFMDPEKASNIHISSAPLAEGVISAAVQCGAGATIKNSINEAEESLYQKIEYLGGESELTADSKSTVSSGDKTIFKSEETGFAKKYTIVNENGLHARPAAKFIKAVSDSGCSNVKVTNLTKNRGPVNGRSFNRLSSLEVLENDEILVEAFSDEISSNAFFRELDLLVGENFGEKMGIIREGTGEAQSITPDNNTCISREEQILKGTGKGLLKLSSGIALGKVWFPGSISLEKKAEKADNSEEEVEKLHSALDSVKAEIKKTVRKNNIEEDKMQIIETHLFLLEDPDLKDESIRKIRDENYNASSAWSISANDVIERYERLEDEYLKARAADVRDVASRVYSFLKGNRQQEYHEIPSGAVIAAKWLSPSQILQLDPEKTEGIILSDSDATSHAAILIKSLGIPALGGYSKLSEITEEDYICFDADSESVFVNPDHETLDTLKRKKEAYISEREKLIREEREPSYTKDGKRINIYANIASVSEAAAAVKNGADGVGVLRTEFLFLEKNSPPTEDEQFSFFSTVFKIMEGRPVTIRTLDIGGDKVIPYMKLPYEDNPFLGMRGVRIYESYRKLLKTHIRAILRAGLDNDLKIMIPMISQYDECEKAYNLINEVHKDLLTEGIKHIWPVETGIMIETPSSVFMSSELAGICDFFSIGTNDLTQYMLAAERGNKNLASYSDPYDPAVIRAVRKTVLSAENAGIDVSLCGELGGDPDAATLLIGIGIYSLSMNPSQIPLVKKAVRNISSKECNEKCVSTLFKAVSAGDVRKFMKK